MMSMLILATITKNAIVFDDVIADMEYNKNFKKMIKELFYRGRKMNISIFLLGSVILELLKM